MDLDSRIRKLYFRSSHRGSKETDIILAPYAEKNLAKMSPKELDIFEAFLEESDGDIWDWVVGKPNHKSQDYNNIIADLTAIYSVKN